MPLIWGGPIHETFAGGPDDFWGGLFELTNTQQTNEERQKTSQKSDCWRLYFINSMKHSFGAKCKSVAIKSKTEQNTREFILAEKVNKHQNVFCPKI